VTFIGSNGVRPDRDEIRRLYEEHGRGLIAYACSFLHGFTAAEDVLHQIFVRLLRGDIRLESPCAPYLYKAVRNASLNYLRDRSRDTELDDVWLESPSGMTEDAVLLQSALRELPEEQREVIVLHVWGQMSFEEVAATIGIPAKTAASRYRYGIEKLRLQFNPVPHRGAGPALTKG
jgi:RNA polymerase sigma-70 factor, ECF subfamily